MFVRTGAGIILLQLLSGVALATPAPAPSSTPASLSAEQMSQAIKTDSVTIPTPGELFTALGKTAKLDWAGRYRGPIAMNYKTRAQIALNIGGLIADGFIAFRHRTRSR